MHGLVAFRSDGAGVEGIPARVHGLLSVELTKATLHCVVGSRPKQVPSADGRSRGQAVETP